MSDLRELEEILKNTSFVFDGSWDKQVAKVVIKRHNKKG